MKSSSAAPKGRLAAKRRRQRIGGRSRTRLPETGGRSRPGFRRRGTRSRHRDGTRPLRKPRRPKRRRTVLSRALAGRSGGTPLRRTRRPCRPRHRGPARAGADRGIGEQREGDPAWLRQGGERPADVSMVEFADGHGDVLLATSIIEIGLDVPRANTMIVLRADMFGLADLHQLRGRVGRSDVQAICYMMTEPERIFRTRRSGSLPSRLSTASAPAWRSRRVISTFAAPAISLARHRPAM